MITDLAQEDEPIIQIWTYWVHPKPKFELLVPFKIKELNNSQIQNIITTCREKKDPILDSFGPHDVNAFERGKIYPHQQFLMARAIQTLLN